MDQNNQPSAPQLPPIPHFANETPMPPMQPPKRNRKGLWAGIIVAVVVLLGAGTVAGYFLWYQNPDKVMADGIVNAIKADSVSYTGTYTMTSADADRPTVKVEITGKNKLNAAELSANMTFEYEGEEVTVSGGAIVDDNGDLYVRFTEVDVVAEKFAPVEPDSSAKVYIDRLVAKINNQWVKIDADELGAFSESWGETQQCLSDAYKKVQDDNRLMAEIADVYKANRFVVVDETLGMQDGSMGYSLRADEAKINAFNQALKDTEFYTLLHDCNESISSPEITAPSDTTRTELWVSQWSHEITRLTVETTANETTHKAVLEPRFNDVPAIAAPESSVPLEELIEDIRQIMKEAQEAAMAEQGLPANGSAGFSI